MLYRESKNDGTLCVVIPFCERRRILQWSHDKKTSAHLGVRKTLARIKRKYYWPGICRDVIKCAWPAVKPVANERDLYKEKEHQ